MHGTVEWLLRHWGYADQLVAIDRDPLAEQPADLYGSTEFDRIWYVTSQGHTMVIIEAGEFSAPPFFSCRRIETKDQQMILVRGREQDRVADHNGGRPGEGKFGLPDNAVVGAELGRH